MVAMVFALAAAIGFAYGYCVGISQGCLRVGRAISDNRSKTGFQDAVSPPVLAKAMISLTVALLALVAFALWQTGFVITVLAIVTAFVVFGVSTHLVPKPTSSFYVRLTGRSLVRRAADYAKDNDHLRADAAFSLLKKIEQRFPNELLE